MRYNILVIEDEIQISDIIAKYLVSEGYDYFAAKDGFEALEAFNDKKFHLVLLDIMLPGINGFEVLKEIRKISDIPVIILTAKQEEFDRLKGFDMGADDYVVKPFSMKELIKRIKAIIRRIYHDGDEIIYRYKNLSIYTKRMKLFKNETEITLTSVEYKILLTMFKNIGQILTREQLINLAFGQNYEGYDRNIDTYIKRIRKKIEDNPKKPTLLITKYGTGYVFGGMDT